MASGKGVDRADGRAGCHQRSARENSRDEQLVLRLAIQPGLTEQFAESTARHGGPRQQGAVAKVGGDQVQSQPAIQRFQPDLGQGLTHGVRLLPQPERRNWRSAAGAGSRRHCGARLFNFAQVFTVSNLVHQLQHRQLTRWMDLLARFSGRAK